MLRRRHLSVCLLALFAASCSETQPEPTTEGPSVVDAAESTGSTTTDRQVGTGDTKSLTDRAVRWLRSQQQDDGGYGSVADTALVLQALALSPRAYTANEGPFVTRAIDALLAAQKDSGAICEDDAAPEDAVERTLAAARALALYGGSAVGEALLEAEAFLRVPAIEPASLPAMDLAAARALVARSLDEVHTDGWYDGANGPLVATAQRLLDLSAANAALKKAEKAAAGDAPSEANALPSFSAADRAKIDAALERGGRFLVEAASGDGDLWGAMGQVDPGISALVVSALQAVPAERRGEGHDDAIARGLAYLRGLQKDDGSIHIGGQLVNYVTSASILALTDSGEPADLARVANAANFLKELQADEGEGYGPSHKYYGGIGYGGDERPDLSNVWLAASALEEAGISDDDEALAKMIRFLERTQNRSESNDLVLEEDGRTIRPGDDGGAAYAPGQSKAGMVELPDGSVSPRSYGSMTYALLGCYLYAGLSKDDPRVEAAWKWITENYTLDLNPGFEASTDPNAPYQGLFYYFNAMAKALDAYGEDVLVDADGTEHRWREELSGRIVSMQRPDGSWVNENSERWWEGNPVLATAYALVTLDAAMGE